MAGRRAEEAAGRSELNPAPARAEEKAVGDRAPYLTNIAAAATRTITAVGPPRTLDRGSPATAVGPGVSCLLINTKVTKRLLLAEY